MIKREQIKEHSCRNMSKRDECDLSFRIYQTLCSFFWNLCMDITNIPNYALYGAMNTEFLM